MISRFSLTVLICFSVLLPLVAFPATAFLRFELPFHLFIDPCGTIQYLLLSI